MAASLESSLVYTKDDGSKAFVHDTYQDFFLAKWFADKINKGSMDSKQVIQKCRNINSKFVTSAPESIIKRLYENLDLETPLQEWNLTSLGEILKRERPGIIEVSDKTGCSWTIMLDPISIRANRVDIALMVFGFLKDPMRYVDELLDYNYVYASICLDYIPREFHKRAEDKVTQHLFQLLRSEDAYKKEGYGSREEFIESTISLLEEIGVSRWWCEYELSRPQNKDKNMAGYEKTLKNSKIG
jgi:hypothetical protein